MSATAKRVHEKQADLAHRELAELGEECARVLLLLQRLAKVQASGGDTSEILGDLSATVVHLNAHTKGLDHLIDDLASE